MLNFEFKRTRTSSRTTQHAKVIDTTDNLNQVIAYGKSYFVNRPWEYFDYQSAILDAGKKLALNLSEPERTDFMAALRETRNIEAACKVIKQYFEKEETNGTE